MEFYNRMKQKLAEELENVEPPDFPEGNGTDDVESLKNEIVELKHHLNSNYTVYLRRLEKRKTRIKDLEVCLRNVSEENEKLLKEAEQAEAYRIKFEDCREQLEQLESYQSQELGKVKHMLLMTESELQAERMKSKEPNCNGSSPHVEVEQPVTDNSLKKQAREFQDELAKMTESRASLATKVQSLEKDLEDVRTQLSATSTERDGLKTSLLEIEIANHEGDQAKMGELETMKVEVAKLQAEIETLRVTLDVRENEIKSRKEDIRREKENHEAALRMIEAKDCRITTLEAELGSLKSTLSERLMQLRDAQKASDALQEEVETLQNDLQGARSEMGQLRAENETQVKRYDKLCEENSRLMSHIETCNAESAKQTEEIASLKAIGDQQLHEMQALQDQVDVLSLEKSDMSNELSQLRDSIPNLIESSDLVKSLHDKVYSLEEEVQEKKQAVRHLQLRSNEMKKMLQKEMKSSDIGSSLRPEDSPPSPTPPKAPSPLLMRSVSEERSSTPDHRGSSLPPSSAASDTAVVSDVTLKYLRNVIFKFLTSPELEAKHMTKALATLLNFSPSEERLLQEYLDWKMSWFGSKPKLLA